MATEWFYQDAGNEIGPLSSQDFLAKVRDGVIQPSTPVRKDDSQWVDASEVNGLFDAAIKDRTYHCPFCNAQINKPPSTCRACRTWVEFSENFEDPRAQAEQDAKSGRRVVNKVATWVRSLMTED